MRFQVVNMSKIQAVPGVCIGCRLCTVWCKVEHSASRNINKAFKSGAPETVSCVEVEECGEQSFALQCRQCDEPLCVYGCITGALQKDPETGVVTLNESKCVSCWTCVLMCPNGAVKRDSRGDSRAIKCDMCVERGFPSCVEHCPNDALILVEDGEEQP